MKRIFTFFIIAASLVGCTKDEIIPTDPNTITGYHNNIQTKTDFGTPSGTSIPFVWSEGDKIWNGSQQSSVATINPDGGASFTFGTEPAGTVYYNMTGTSATTAVVPAEQDAAKHLGMNGDFAWATIADGSFTLNHATSYLWFDIASLPADHTLDAVAIDAGDALITGTAQWNGSAFETPENGSSSATLLVNKTSIADAEVVMVVLPAQISSATITYTLSSNGVVKYCKQTVGEKTLVAGSTYKISIDFATASVYELRTLSFEDSDAKFTPYELEYYNNKQISKWSDLIAADQYGDYMLGYGGWYGECMPTEESHYSWYDENNTFLAHDFPYNYYTYCLAGGGHAISKYASNDYISHGSYTHQLTVYDKDANGLVTTGGGHNGSNNFAMHYGYFDNSEWNQTTEDALPAIYFKDDKARIIDHLWVCLSTYEYNCLYEGNGLTEPLGDGDYVKIEAIGHKEDGTTVRTSIKVADLKSGVIDDWTKWDLSSLGKVKRVQFNIIGTNDNGYGFSQPAYFAYDDVAVRFEN